MDGRVILWWKGVTGNARRETKISEKVNKCDNLIIFNKYRELMTFYKGAYFSERRRIFP